MLLLTVTHCHSLLQRRPAKLGKLKCLAAVFGSLSILNWCALATPLVQGAIPMGVDDWDAARVLAGRPRRGAELTEQHNPLEAGLYGAVSLNKGCYIGQVGI